MHNLVFYVLLDDSYENGFGKNGFKKNCQRIEKWKHDWKSLRGLENAFRGIASEVRQVLAMLECAVCYLLMTLGKSVLRTFCMRTMANSLPFYSVKL